MANVLSHSEIESLLESSRSLGGRKSAEIAVGSGRPSAGAGALPGRATPRQWGWVQTLPDRYWRPLGADLSRLLRTAVVIDRCRADCLSYREFFESMESSGCAVIFNTPEFDTPFVLSLPAAVAVPVIDCLLGGGAQFAAAAARSREFTQIECQLLQRVAEVVRRRLESAWGIRKDPALIVVEIAGDQRLIQIAGPEDPVLLMQADVAVGNSRGVLSFCLPCRSWERLMSPDESGADGLRSTTRDGVGEGLGPGLQSTVELVAVLAAARLSISELRCLAVGDTILTMTDCRQPVSVSAGGQPLFIGMGGLAGGHKGVRICEETRGAAVTASVCTPADSAD